MEMWIVDRRGGWAGREAEWGGSGVGEGVCEGERGSCKPAVGSSALSIARGLSLSWSRSICRGRRESRVRARALSLAAEESERERERKRESERASETEREREREREFTMNDSWYQIINEQ